ncbi:7-carboxy-7-deazaguanine synthase QueE [Priestia sp. YIM B13446]|uniref:7-carboxy-7-deazaguanine synthase QueE n=1 Tax=Priestia TaxID=2800373 RepID=UPI0009BCF890|nr:7-carboxy-7-deazaguanine synthase QueE [Priestia megaterium]MCU7740014.1 7-carboxy-7-deazaguanine synthase QueE [Priestia megaterium]MCU7745388.1 7-carboxy-7-deazaguanine synthase QueE [Priestia megaterium]MDC7723073.1 7-carboxy-7-deazaguanine synthase QueE [Priestia megaterium]MED4062227.1 7-carboxy-7-deazaguanine synthase QueE [Priestia megaterium]PEZ12354.1 7-carboxy-7-deazaguanine synthase QueE [Priestia megaterium]
MANTIPVLEIFGPTIQGEGMVVGRKTMFVRTAGCDYSCSWCDSAFTWDGSAKNDIRQLTAEQIWTELKEIGGDCFDHVTISGGNPALIKAIGSLVELLHSQGVKAALETQGSRYQDWFLKIDDLTISPKPPSSLMKTNFSVLDDIIETLLKEKRMAHISIKVVVFNDEDFEYAASVHERYPEVPFFVQVGNEDLTTIDNASLTQELLKKYEWLIDKAVAAKNMNDVRVLPQVHALVWGNKRGV